MITFAKGVTSGYVPLGGVLVSERIARHFDSKVLWALTYSGHPPGVRGRLRQPGLVDRSRSRSGPSPMKKFLEGALARGTYLMARYNVFLVAPPLGVADDEIEEGVRAGDGAPDDIGA